MHFNVTWKVNVRARSELSHFTAVCLSDVVVCEVERTSTRLLPTARTVLTLSVISASACFLLPLRLRALQAKDEHTGKKNTTSLNDETKITLHTQTNTPATPAQHFLDLAVTSSYCPGPSVPNKTVVICAASHPVSLSVSLFLFCLSSPALLLLVFIVAAVCVSSLSRQQEDRATCL